MDYFEWLGKQVYPYAPPSRIDIWNAALDQARKAITQSSKGYPDEMVEEFVMELEKLKS